MILPPNSYSLFGYDEQLVEQVDYLLSLPFLPKGDWEPKA